MGKSGFYNQCMGASTRKSWKHKKCFNLICLLGTVPGNMQVWKRLAVAYARPLYEWCAPIFRPRPHVPPGCHRGFPFNKSAQVVAHFHIERPQVSFCRCRSQIRKPSVAIQPRCGRQSRGQIGLRNCLARFACAFLAPAGCQGIEK